MLFPVHLPWGGEKKVFVFKGQNGQVGPMLFRWSTHWAALPKEVADCWDPRAAQTQVAKGWAEG